MSDHEQMLAEVGLHKGLFAIREGDGSSRGTSVSDPVGPSGDTKLILRERAQRLARKTQDADRRSDGIAVIEFMLAHERYAVEVAWLREVYPLKDVTAVPLSRLQEHLPK